MKIEDSSHVHRSNLVREGVPMTDHSEVPTGFRFNIEVQRKGALRYVWTVLLEEDGFLTPIAEGKSYSSRSARKTATGYARAWVLDHHGTNANNNRKGGRHAR